MSEPKLIITEIKIDPTHPSISISFEGVIETKEWHASINSHPFYVNDHEQVLQVVRNLLEKGTFE